MTSRVKADEDAILTTLKKIKAALEAHPVGAITDQAALMDDLPAPWDLAEDQESRLRLLMQAARETAEQTDYLEAHPPSSLPKENPAAILAARQHEFERLQEWFEKTQNPMFAWGAIRLCLKQANSDALVGQFLFAPGKRWLV